MKSQDKKTLVILTGPTGIGKTAMSIEIAEHFKTEIISCDSRQFYKEMSIGTAVPPPVLLQRIKHHFIQNLSIHDYYNVSMFEKQVLELLNQLFKEKDIVLMTGGSGLYIDAVYKGIDDLPNIDPGIRDDLAKKWKNEGIECLRAMLKIIDPQYYEQVDLKNPKRILKGLEISIMTGKPYSQFLTNPRKKRDFNILLIGLNKNREELYDQINSRVEKMMEEGLFEEAKNLFPHKEINALNTVGYKELFNYIEGKINLDEAVDLIKRNTRKYARRQITWLGRYNHLKWFHPMEIDQVIQHIKEKGA